MPEGTIKKLTDRGFGFTDTGSEADMLRLHGGSFAGRLSPRFRHRSYSTTSEGAAASNFNSYWDIPATTIECDCASNESA